MLFRSENLTSVYFTFGFTEIGDGAFLNCVNLRNVYVPYSMSKIGNFVFKNCKSLTSLNYAGTEEKWAEIVKGFGLQHLTVNKNVSEYPSTNAYREAV